MDSMALDQYLVYLLENLSLTGQTLTRAKANAELLRGMLPILNQNAPDGRWRTLAGSL